MSPVIHLVVSLAGCLVFVWWALRGPLSDRTRLAIGVLWGLVGLIHLLMDGGKFDRLIGVAILASTYIVLMPFLPWHRRG
jgi:hypothetical protein